MIVHHTCKCGASFLGGAEKETCTACWAATYAGLDEPAPEPVGDAKLWRCRWCGSVLFLQAGRDRQGRVGHWRGCAEWGDVEHDRIKEDAMMHRTSGPGVYVEGRAAW